MLHRNEVSAMKRTIALLWIAFCHTAPVFPQEIGLIDLTNPPFRESMRHPRTLGDACGGVSHPQIQRQVKVTIVSLDKTVYRPGDDLTFEVTVQNIGRRAVLVPWTPHASDVEPENDRVQYSCRVSSIILRFEDPEQHTFSVGSSLYGSRSVPGSLRLLAPGESFRVQARLPFRPLAPGWTNEELAEKGPFLAKVQADFREDIRTFTPANGGAMTDSCTDIHSIAADPVEITVEPR
jgi:hypothetical protein